MAIFPQRFCQMRGVGFEAAGEGFADSVFNVGNNSDFQRHL
jgi:hypothetical protein